MWYKDLVKTFIIKKHYWTKQVQSTLTENNEIKEYCNISRFVT